MEFLKTKIHGDKTIWIILIIIILISILSIFSSSTLIASMMGVSAISVTIKHIILSFMGLLIVYFVHNIPSKYFGLISIALIPIVIMLLLFILMQGNSESGETTARWIRLPIIGSFQPSTLGILTILILTARFLSSKKYKDVKFVGFIKNLVLPVGIIILLILPSNFSTAFIGFTMFLVVLFIGGFKARYILGLITIGVGILFLFFLLIKSFPDKIPNRVVTWENRINNFLEDGNKYDYQIEKAKAAISNGGFFGRGPGKSKQKYFLPQSNTDFIFSVIVEEYGFLGALVIISLYLLLFFRVVIIVTKSKKKIQKLLVISAIMPIMFSAFINMGVATNILPVTGQTLPFISSGGTSIMIYSMSIGIILSVSRESKIKKKEIVQLDED